MLQETDSSESEEGSPWPDLVDRIAEGDEAAFSAFYDQTRSLVYGLVLRIVSQVTAAEEVMMDVYLQVWRQAANYRESRGTPYTWLMMVARSRALDRIRREKRGAAFAWENFAEGFDIADKGHSPQSLAEVKQTRSRVSGVLSELPAEQRHVIELSFYEGMSHVEIAERLQLPLGTVKSRIRSAIGRFRQVLVREAV